MRKTLLRILGVTLWLPLIINIVLPVLGMIAHKSGYERWLFEKNIFPMLDWADGSYIKAAIVWFGSAALFMGYVWLQVYCWTYQTPEEKQVKRYKDWINA